MVNNLSMVERGREDGKGGRGREREGEGGRGRRRGGGERERKERRGREGEEGKELERKKGEREEREGEEVGEDHKHHHIKDRVHHHNLRSWVSPSFGTPNWRAKMGEAWDHPKGHPLSQLGVTTKCIHSEDLSLSIPNILCCISTML